MNFYDELEIMDKEFVKKLFTTTSRNEVIRILEKETIDEYDFAKLLSENGLFELEKMAKKSKILSLNNFGKAITIYSPLYISNFCDNRCLYCSFNKNNQISRVKLSNDEIEMEADYLHSKGINHILLLTGESRAKSPFEYIVSSIRVLKKYFVSISIEIYPLNEIEYKILEKLGVYGVTVYQETYDQEIYSKVHISGKKRDYLFRLNTPENIANANIKSLNIGVLLGLSDWKMDVFILGLHAKYLAKKFPELEIGLSFPRIKKISTTEDENYNYMEVSDKEFVQIITSIRLFLPYVSVNISTRESKEFRRNIIPLGVNKMSAEVSTEVGGHVVYKNSISQFEISDHSAVKDVEKLIYDAGYQPILRDWVNLYD
ncbi:2-iminoacetate synthase ThiH [Helicovermis profundi]|uniref:2-iminoacetate synthase ThiH n=1 Tax=Helicovermis profundi TaxID=3065157 RepID=A0AAU9ET32_9FIRM|nr:2-iminoacetate synthase ThiH [Clostridia bacterium S502]